MPQSELGLDCRVTLPWALYALACVRLRKISRNVRRCSERFKSNQSAVSAAGATCQYHLITVSPYEDSHGAVCWRIGQELDKWWNNVSAQKAGYKILMSTLSHLPTHSLPTKICIWKLGIYLCGSELGQQQVESSHGTQNHPTLPSSIWLGCFHASEDRCAAVAPQGAPPRKRWWWWWLRWIVSKRPNVFQHSSRICSQHGSSWKPTVETWQ